MEEALRRRVVIGAVPEEVWDALIAPDRLAAWFGADVDLVPRPDGAVTFRMPDGCARRGVVEVVEPPRRFAFRWRSVAIGPDGIKVGDVSRVEFDLTATGDGGTILTVTESPGVLATDAQIPIGSGGGRR